MTCAFAVRGAFRKLSGVESVDVSLNKGLAAIRMKPGNTLTIEQFWETVRQNGFTPRETSVVLRGEILQLAGKLELKVSGSNRAYELVADPKVPHAIDELRSRIGKTLTLEGTLTPPKDLKSAVPIRVRNSRL